VHQAPTSKPVRQERRPARDEVEEVAPGVLRLQLPISMPGLGHVNCYAMEDSKGIALVDPGLPGPRTWRRLKRHLTSAGLSVDRVHTVVITHSHPDHFGQAARLAKRTGAEIVTHRSFRTFLDPTAEEFDDETHTVLDKTADQTPAEQGHDHQNHGHTHGHTHGAAGGGGQAPANRADPGPFGRTTPWGGKPFQLPLNRRMKYWAIRKASGRFMSTPKPSERVEDTQVLSLGGREWVSVHTPGHTPDHLCLWDPANGVMISGDHVLPTITPHISGLGFTPDPLAEFFTSLDRMQSFDGVKTVLPAHGLEFADLTGRAESIKLHHHERLDILRQSGERLGQGTVEAYMKELFQPRSWGSMAESETYAHLEHLRLARQAKVVTGGEQLRYEILG